jgi:hypothetical protein
VRVHFNGKPTIQPNDCGRYFRREPNPNGRVLCNPFKPGFEMSNVSEPVFEKRRRSNHCFGTVAMNDSVPMK